MKKTSILKVLLSFLLTACILAGASTVIAAEERPVIAAVTATSSGITYPSAAGEEVKTPTSFSVTEGSPAFIAESMTQWVKKQTDGKWVQYSNTVFIPGEYRLSVQLRTNNCKEVIATSTTLTIDGTAFTPLTDSVPYVGTDYSFETYFSPVYTLSDAGLPLTLAEMTVLSGKIYAGTTISPVSFADAVYGGKAPYSFSKISGPDWIDVDKNGLVSGVPGVPATAGEATSLVIEVTDAEGKTARATISVPEVYPDPASRTPIDSVIAHTEYTIPYPLTGGSAAISTLIIEQEDPACGIKSSIRWQIKNSDGTWSEYYDPTFVTGTYRIYCQIIASSETHMITSSTVVIINGETFTKTSGEPYAASGLSYDYWFSKEYEVKEAALIPSIPVWVGVYTDWDENGKINLEEIDPGAKHVSIGQQFMTGSTLTAVAYANEGYEFSHWLDENHSIVSTADHYSFTVYDATYLNPIFKTHTHSYSPDWKTDPEKHYHECLCESIADAEPHVWSEWVVITEPTEQTAGSKKQTCTTCGYENVVEIEKVTHKHTLEYVKGSQPVPACTETGLKGYYKCSSCGKLYEDEAATVEITDEAALVIPATGHVVPDNWTSDDDYHWKKCSNAYCEAVIEGSKEEHVSSEWIIDREPEDGKDGEKHKECTVCGKVLKTRSISAEDPDKPGEASHSPLEIAAIIAVCLVTAAVIGAVVIITVTAVKAAKKKK